METEAAKYSVERKSFEIKEKEILLENDRLLEIIISQDLVHTVVNSLAEIIDYQSMEKSFLDEYSECVKLKTELSKKNKMVEKAIYDELLKRCARMENICISLEIKMQQYKESFQNNQPQNIQVASFVSATRSSSSKQSESCVMQLYSPKNQNKFEFADLVKHQGPTQNTGRTFTIDENMCPLTRITFTTVVPPKKPLSTTVVKKTLSNSNNSRKLKDITNIGKSKKHTHKPKSDDSIQEKLYLMHMDLCGPMRIESINGKKYILVIVDDYSRKICWIMETIHVEFDELTAMASEQFGLGPELQLMTLGTIILAATAPRPADPTGSPLSTSIDQATPSTSISLTIQETQSPNQVLKNHDDTDEEMNDDENADEVKDDQVVDDAEKVDSNKTKKEKVDIEQARDDQANNDDQAKVDKAEYDQGWALKTLIPLPTPPTLIKAPTITTTVPDPLPAVLQRLSDLERKFESWTKVDHSEAIEESVQANIIKVKNNCLKLYDALLNSIMLDEAIASGDVNPDKVLRKRDYGDDQDPTTGSDQRKKKKRKGKDSKPSKDKVQTGSSSKGKTQSKPSSTNKPVNAEKPLHEAEMNVEEPILDDVVNEADQLQDDATPTQGNPIWFKQPPRPPTPDPEWNKDKNIDDGPE
ncbi:integrase, catalytic region, zinc finger, CCHC-type containing protein [Tanacetum coccineum]